MTPFKTSLRIALLVAWASLLARDPRLWAAEPTTSRPSTRITFVVVDADDREVETITVGERFYDPLDSDFDGLSDQYELLFFHSLSESGDLDGDGLPDKLEGNDLSESADVDEDGLPDAWERKFFDSLKFGPHDNPDRDDFTNVEELVRGSSFLPDRQTTIEYSDQPAGSYRRGPDGKRYNEYFYKQKHEAGIFTIPWDKLKAERVRNSLHRFDSEVDPQRTLD